VIGYMADGDVRLNRPPTSRCRRCQLIAIAADRCAAGGAQPVAASVDDTLIATSVPVVPAPAHTLTSASTPAPRP